MTTLNKHLNRIHFLTLAQAKSLDALEAAGGQVLLFAREDLLPTPTKSSPTWEKMNRDCICHVESFGTIIA